MAAWFTEIVRGRDIGVTRCFITTREEETILEVALRFGLKYGERNLLEVSRAQAVSILQSLLHRDIAYRSDLMDAATAARLAEEAIEALSGANARYFSNGQWDIYFYGQGDGFQFTSMTESTFDGGVIVVSERMAGGIWIEDED